MWAGIYNLSTENKQLEKDVRSLQRTIGLRQNKIKTLIADNTNLIKEQNAMAEEIAGSRDTARVLQAIIQCESGFDPKALNKNSKHSLDIGLFQINTRWHQATAKKMGLNIYDTADNVKYGLYLFEKEGIHPWKASKKCIKKIMEDNNA